MTRNKILEILERYESLLESNLMQQEDELPEEWVAYDFYEAEKDFIEAMREKLRKEEELES